MRSIYKNSEGYGDPTAGEAIRNTTRMPPHIWNVYKMLDAADGIAGLN